MEGLAEHFVMLQGQCLSLTKVGQSAVTVVCFKSMYHWKDMDIRNTYAKNERPVSYSKRVMANVQKYVKGHSQGHTFKIYCTI